jgi:hypothetical protein
LEERKLDFVDSDAVQASLHSAYVLKIALCHNEDDAWKRVKVPDAIDLRVPKLHDQVIIPEMGWSRTADTSLRIRKMARLAIGPARYGGYIDMMHVPMTYYHIIDDRRIPLAALLRSEEDFWFCTYDLAR